MKQRTLPFPNLMSQNLIQMTVQLTRWSALLIDHCPSARQTPVM